MKATIAAATFAFAAAAAGFAAAAPLPVREVLLAEREFTDAGFTEELTARSIADANAGFTEELTTRTIADAAADFFEVAERDLAFEDSEDMWARTLDTFTDYFEASKRGLDVGVGEELWARSLDTFAEYGITTRDVHDLEPRFFKGLGRLFGLGKGQQSQNQRRSLIDDDEDFELEARAFDEEDLKVLQERLVQLVKGLVKRLRQGVAKKIAAELNGNGDNGKKAQAQQLKARNVSHKDAAKDAGQQAIQRVREELLEDLSVKDLKMLQSRLIGLIKKFIGDLRKDKADGKVWDKPQSQGQPKANKQEQAAEEQHKRSLYDDEEAYTWEARDLDAMFEGRDDYMY